MAAFVRSVGLVLRFGQSSSLANVQGNPLIITKRYVRGLKRRPVKVIHPDGKEERLVKTHQPPSRQKDELHARTTRKDDSQNVNATRFHSGENDLQFSKTPKKSNESLLSNSFTMVDGLRFERAKPDDKRLSKLVTIARSRTYREHQGKILLEGKRLICDALAAGAKPQTVFFSSVERLAELPMDKLQRASLVKVKFEEIKKWSEVIAPQGVIAIFSRPDVQKLSFPKEQRGQTVPMSLICDNIRDPGNLGTILRCAAAAGCDNVLLSKGCVDTWEPKVLRAAMGAHFRIPIIPSLSWEDISQHLPSDVTVHVADNCSSPARRDDVIVNNHQEPKELAKPSDYGWVSGRREKRQLQQHSELDYSDSDSENSDSDVEEEVDERPQVEPRLYHQPWAQRSTALVIGGETHGLSLESLQLAEQTDGRRLYVPLAHGVDSLNSAMAASILLFEGRRQLMMMMMTKGAGAERSGRRVRN